MCLVLRHFCGRSSSCTCQERIWHAEEPNVAKQFLLTLIIYICYFFRFDASLKKLFVSCHYHVLFVCLAPAVFKVKHSVFLNIFRYQDYARPTLHCNIDSHIFSWLLLPEILFIFQFWWELNMLEFHFVTRKICSF